MSQGLAAAHAKGIVLRDLKPDNLFVTGAEPADVRSDVFSFGCVLDERLAGRRAFSRGSAIETLHGILMSDIKSRWEAFRA